jgi:hypothetical protein
MVFAVYGCTNNSNGSSGALTATGPSAALNVGDTFSLTATQGGKAATVTWSSANTSVATVSGSTLTAVGGGTSIITATLASDTTVTGSFTVSVNAPVVPKYTVVVTPDVATDTVSSITVGDTATLSATLNGSAVTAVSFSSAAAVATVTGTKLTAVGAGTTIITASATDSSKGTGTVTVTVVAPTTPDGGLAISTVAQFESMNSYVHGGSVTGTFYLTNDIDFSSDTTFTQIGSFGSKSNGIPASVRRHI